MDTWIWVVIILAAVIVVSGAALWVTGRQRRAGLQTRFGDEYDRTVDAAESRRAAERDLHARESRHDELELRPLSDASRARFQHDWDDVQAHFVDRPEVATTEADRLITQLMQERGYPVDDFESKSDLVSVDHPDVVENYRTANAISHRNVEGQATTEDLRQAIVAYRSLFEELLTDSTNA